MAKRNLMVDFVKEALVRNLLVKHGVLVKEAGFTEQDKQFFRDSIDRENPGLSRDLEKWWDKRPGGFFREPRAKSRMQEAGDVLKDYATKGWLRNDLITAVPSLAAGYATYAMTPSIKNRLLRLLLAGGVGDGNHGASM